MVPPVVSLSWWESHRDEVVLAYVLRAGGGPGHGGVVVDLERWLSGPPSPAAGRHPLPSPEVFAEGMAAAGIGDDDTVVAYDDASGVFAARLVWMLRVTGRAAALLDGVPAAPAAVSRPRAVFTPRPWPAAALASLEDALDPTQVVVDARPRARFHGLPTRSTRGPGTCRAHGRCRAVSTWGRTGSCCPTTCCGRPSPRRGSSRGRRWWRTAGRG